MGDTVTNCTVSEVDKYRSTEWVMKSSDGRVIQGYFPFSDDTSTSFLILEMLEDYDPSSYTNSETLTIEGDFIRGLTEDLYNLTCNLLLDSTYSDTIELELFIPGQFSTE